VSPPAPQAPHTFYVLEDVMNSTIRMRFITAGIWALLMLAAVVSATHIVETAGKLGVDGWQRYAAVALIDFVAIVGKLSMHPSFTPAFRTSGFRLLMAGGVLSLAANIYAGHNLGQKAFGALTVGVFMLLEHHATKAGKTAVAPPAEPTVDLELKARRSEAARKAAATRAANKAAASKPTRKPRAPKAATVRDLEAAYSLPSAPVSGA
jgi:hypothetical protein